jgi:hypothetical protein
MNLNSNFLLIGLILVSITCIYLLYININRSNETDSIKQNIKVLISQNKKRDEILNYVIDKLDTLNNTVNTNSTPEHTISNSQLNQVQQHNPEENNINETDVVTEEQVKLENELYDVQTLYTEDLQKQPIDTNDNETDYNSLLSSVTNNVNLGNDIYSDENNNFSRMSSSTENDEENHAIHHNDTDDEGIKMNDGLDTNNDNEVNDDNNETDDEENKMSDGIDIETIQLNEQNQEHNNEQLDLDDINLNELDIEKEFTELLNNGDDNGFVMEQFDVTTKITSDIPVEQNVVVTNLNDIVSQEEVSQEEVSQEEVSQEEVSQEEVSQEEVSQEEVSQEEVSQEEVSLEEKLKNILEQENISLNPSESESESEDIYSLPRNVNVLKNKYSADKLKNFAKSLNVKQTGTKKEIAERIITELNNSQQ